MKQLFDLPLAAAPDIARGAALVAGTTCFAFASALDKGAAFVMFTAEPGPALCL
ncbi:MAG: hypothetical protein NTV73_03560 [Hyphomicrobiales bacterium]|nr:hypothetical protein [Hyphomicrobiales bacterium]